MNDKKISKWQTLPLGLIQKVITAILIMWIWFYPHPYYWLLGCTLVLLPAYAVTNLVFKNRFILDEDKGLDTTKAYIGVSLFFIYSVVGIRLGIDSQTSNELRIATIVFWLTIFLVVVLRKIFVTTDYLAPFVVALSYTYALCMYVNSIETDKVEVEFRGEITRKYTGARTSSYFFVIEHTYQETHLNVGKEQHKNSVVGDTVCFKKATGRMGITTLSQIDCK